MKNKGKLIVVSGFSGAGKGTVMSRLLETKDGYALSVSATTRAPRPGEIDGVHYFFKTRDEFKRMIEENALVEYAQYVENYYGTPRSFVEEKLEKGYNVLLEIEIQGALKIKKQFKDAVLIFITTKDAATLKDRLIKRGTESDEVIRKRLKRAINEADGVENYEYIVINDDLDECVETVDRIVKSAHNRTDENLSVIKEIQACLAADR